MQDAALGSIPLFPFWPWGNLKRNWSHPGHSLSQTPNFMNNVGGFPPFLTARTCDQGPATSTHLTSAELIQKPLKSQGILSFCLPGHQRLLGIAGGLPSTSRREMTHKSPEICLPLMDFPDLTLSFRPTGYQTAKLRNSIACGRTVWPTAAARMCSGHWKSLKILQEMTLGSRLGPW